MLGSWDHEEWVEALRHAGSLSRQRQTSRSWRRSQSSSHQCSQMLVHEGLPWLRLPTCLRDVHMEQLYSPVPLQGVTVVLLCPMMSAPCPKWPQWSMFPPHAWSSHSSERTALASLNQDEALEDDFQTQHMLVYHLRWWGDSGSGSSARGGLECSGGSPGQQAAYCLNIGKEEETLETVDPTWQTTQLAMAVTEGEGVGGHSFSTSKSVLGGNQCRTRCLL